MTPLISPADHTPSPPLFPPGFSSTTVPHWLVTLLYLPPPPSASVAQPPMSSESGLFEQFPPELLAVICAHIYAAGLPPPVPSLDPPLCSDHPDAPTALPSSYPCASWPESVVRRTLANLCLVNNAWNEAAKPWLWRKVEIRLPRSWLAIVEEVAGGDDEEASEERAALMVDRTLKSAETAALAASTWLGECTGDDAASDLHDQVLQRLSGPDISIPPELLTPPASREPSPRRPRTKSKSPARWKLMRSISVAVQDVMERAHPGIYGEFSLFSFGRFRHVLSTHAHCQSRHPTTLTPVGSSAISILTTSGPSECGVLSRRVSTTALSLATESLRCSRLASCLLPRGRSR